MFRNRSADELSSLPQSMRIELRELHACHQTAASETAASLVGAAAHPAVALALAMRSGVSVRRSADLVILASEISDWKGLTSEQSSSSIRAPFAAQRLNESAGRLVSLARKLVEEPLLVPAGVEKLPPPRPLRYEFAGVSLADHVIAQSALESTSNPVSNPGFEAAADPLFSAWFWPGSRTVASFATQLLSVWSTEQIKA
jgi:hypothetical protein